MQARKIKLDYPSYKPKAGDLNISGTLKQLWNVGHSLLVDRQFDISLFFTVLILLYGNIDVWSWVRHRQLLTHATIHTCKLLVTVALMLRFSRFFGPIQTEWFGWFVPSKSVNVRNRSYSSYLIEISYVCSFILFNAIAFGSGGFFVLGGMTYECVVLFWTVFGTWVLQHRSLKEPKEQHTNKDEAGGAPVSIINSNIWLHPGQRGYACASLVFLMEAAVLVANATAGPLLFLECVLVLTIIASCCVLVPTLQMHQNVALWMSLGLHLFMTCTLGRDSIRFPDQPLATSHSCILPVLLALNCIARDYIRCDDTPLDKRNRKRGIMSKREALYTETLIVSMSAIIYFSYAHGLVYVLLQYMLLRRTVDEYYWLFKSNGLVENVSGILNWLKKFVT